MKMRASATLLLCLLAVAGVFAAPNKSALRSFFELIDEDGNGMVTAAEIAAHWMRVEGDELLPHAQARLSSGLHKLVVSKHDADDSGAMEWEEWQQAYGRLDKAEGLSGLHKRDSITSVQPQQVRLATTTKPATEMVIMWITSTLSTNPVAEFGLANSTLRQQVSGTWTTYNAGVLGWSGHIHTVTLRNLQPAQTYNYRVGDPTHNAWSPIHRFSTMDPHQTEVRIATFGDMGTVMPMGFEVTKQMIKDDADINFQLIVHAGDIAYGGVSHEWEFEYIWDLWGEQVSPLGDHIPYMVAVGNHEKYYNFTSYKARFNMPGHQSGGIDNFYHSFDYGGIHFVSICTEVYAYPYERGSAQYAWLERDLAAANANRKNSPFIIVVGHRPMYSSDKSSDSGPLKRELEPLLNKYGVDLAIWGHMHSYERTWPVFNNTPSVTTGNVFRNVNGTIHLTIGTAGAFSDEAWVEPSPVWSAKHIGTFEDVAYGYGYLHKLDNNRMRFQYRKWDTGKVWDEIWIERTTH